LSKAFQRAAILRGCEREAGTRGGRRLGGRLPWHRNRCVGGLQSASRCAQAPAQVAGAKYQWQLCTAKGCVAIKGATKTSLKLLRGYAGKSVRVRETLHGKTVFSKKLKVRAASK
jgi:hypothetical protein